MTKKGVGVEWGKGGVVGVKSDKEGWWVVNEKRGVVGDK